MRLLETGYSIIAIAGLLLAAQARAGQAQAGQEIHMAEAETNWWLNKNAQEQAIKSEIPVIEETIRKLQSNEARDPYRTRQVAHAPLTTSCYGRTSPGITEAECVFWEHHRHMYSRRICPKSHRCSENAEAAAFGDLHAIQAEMTLEALQARLEQVKGWANAPRESQVDYSAPAGSVHVRTDSAAAIPLRLGAQAFPPRPVIAAPAAPSAPARRALPNDDPRRMPRNRIGGNSLPVTPWVDADTAEHAG